MKTAIFLVLAICITGILFSSAVAAQSPNDWSNVEGLDVKTKVIVETRTGKTIKGRVSFVTPTILNLRSDGRAVALPQTEIARVYRTKSGSRLKGAGIGAGVGAATGVGLGILYTVTTKKGKGLAVAAGLLYGLPVGAAIGAIAGGKAKKGVLIYEAR